MVHYACFLVKCINYQNVMCIQEIYFLQDLARFLQVRKILQNSCKNLARMPLHPRILQELKQSGHRTKEKFRYHSEQRSRQSCKSSFAKQSFLNNFTKLGIGELVIHYLVQNELQCQWNWLNTLISQIFATALSPVWKKLPSISAEKTEFSSLMYRRNATFWHFPCKRKSRVSIIFAHNFPKKTKET